MKTKRNYKRNKKKKKKKRNKYSSDMPKLESDLLQSLERVGWGQGRGRRCNGWGRGRWAGPPLEGEPGVAQALRGRGPLLGHQLQHWKQEVGEALGLLPRPLVLVDQHLQQAPGLQLGDVLQVTCRRPHSATSERPWPHATDKERKKTLRSWKVNLFSAVGRCVRLVKRATGHLTLFMHRL